MKNVYKDDNEKDVTDSQELDTHQVLQNSGSKVEFHWSAQSGDTVPPPRTSAGAWLDLQKIEKLCQVPLGRESCQMGVPLAGRTGGVQHWTGASDHMSRAHFMLQREKEKCSWFFERKT